MGSSLKACVAGALLPVLLTGCLQHTVDAGTGANAVPPNYRQIVASSIASKIDTNAFRDPKISPPYVIHGLAGDEPHVCVIAEVVGGGENPAWIFLFENGRVSKMYEPSRAEGCRGLDWTPFPEFSRRM